VTAASVADASHGVIAQNNAAVLIAAMVLVFAIATSSLAVSDSTLLLL
jgi:hypothetical protein